MTKQKKILFGAVDIGWRIEHYTKFIKTTFQTTKVSSVVYYKVAKQQYQTSYTYEYDLNSLSKLQNWTIRIVFFIKALFKYDVFYFFSGETLLTRKLRKLEFIIYKLFNKQIVIHFVGSDIRSPKYIDWKTENIYQYDENMKFSKSEVWQNKLTSDTKKYASHTIVSTPDLLEIVPFAKYIPVFIDIEKFNHEISKIDELYKDENYIYILHAPSNKRMKGTGIIEKVLNKVSKKYNIKVVYPKSDTKSNYSVTRYELFRYYQQADIVIDQLIIGWYGLQAIEALLCDSLVISYMEENLESYSFQDCPVINANAENLEAVVVNAIKNVKLTNFQQQKSWVKQYHSIENNQNFIKLMHSICD